MPFTKGQPGGPGRTPKREKFARPIARAEKQIADKLPWLIDKAMELAEGVQVEKPGLVGPVVYRLPPDITAIKYLLDRIMGKPTERRELSGPDGAPINVTSTAMDAAAKELETWRKQKSAELLNMPSAPPTPPTSSTDTA